MIKDNKQKLEDFKSKVNRYTKNGVPYLFVLDFELEKPFVCKLEDVEKENIFYSIKGKGNLPDKKQEKKISLITELISKDKYTKAFTQVLKAINKGDSYLLNLTFSNKIKLRPKLGLKEILLTAKATYKLFFKDKFISFSPESFIQIKKNEIFTFPMKGTINAEIENAKTIILNDSKETQEHNTIVDLLRNDLSIVATDVKINKFRYIDKLKTSKGDILQVSSEISGVLPNNWRENFGGIILKLLPAGSISGAPKQKTVKIIKEVEQNKRGYYTGVFGVFDGENVDSAVLIRYIEKLNNELFYKSGGGITYQSNVESEYEELFQKIYIPY